MLSRRSALATLLVISFLHTAPQLFGETKQATLPDSRLRAEFKNPPAEAKLRCYWWWLNGNTDKATITHDLEEMKAKGIGGALLVDADGSGQEGHKSVPAGPTFASPAWIELYKHALREADRLGIEITLNINSGWNLGGPYVKPEEASKVLTYSRIPHKGGRFSLSLPKPYSQHDFYRDIAVLVYPLYHGTALTEQPDDKQGDQFIFNTHAANKSALSLLFRSAAIETGFSMPDSSPMLNSGIETQFAPDPIYADARLSDVKDVTSLLQPDGSLSLDLPEGQWEILRVGYTDSGARVSTSSGAWQGLAIDHMSRKAFEAYWAQTVEPLLEAAKPYHSLKYLATDSWELQGTNWTEDFRARFTALRGYDPIPYLPIVSGRILQDRETSTRFLTDLRRTVADLISSEHFDVFAEKAAQHGLGIQAESGGPHGAPIDALETFRHSAIPHSEFWAPNSHRVLDKERFFTKEAASAANIYGKHFVAQEGETAMGPQWSASLASDLKPAFDMAITEGMNRLVWHEFTSSPANTGVPGQEYFAGTHLNPKLTWWNSSASFLTYLNRVQYLMQRGLPVNDVLYYYGDHIPNFVRLKKDDPAQVLPGYDYDVTNEDALLHVIRIEGKELVGPSGVRWKVLVLPKTRRISVSVLEVVKRYVQAGGTVASLPPMSVTGIVTEAEKQRFAALVEEIWGNCTSGSTHSFGKGVVVCSASGREALKAIGALPDLTIQAADPQVHLDASSKEGIDYIHRREGKTNIYFLRNAMNKPAEFLATFRVSGVPELWDSLTGEVTGVHSSVIEGTETTTVAITLPAYGSIAVVFQPQTSPLASPEKKQVRVLPVLVNQPWKITFPGDPGKAATTVTTSELKSWTEWEQPEIKYFSGTATYSASIKAPKLLPGESACLRFGSVREIAEVSLNGQRLPSVWAKPYITCVSERFSSGENQLSLTVSNLWHNRLMGDLSGATPKVTQTNITLTPEPLLPSGIIGPVEWVIFHSRTGNKGKGSF